MPKAEWPSLPEMNAPRHLDKARIRVPKAPSPAILLFNRWPSRADGSELFQQLTHIFRWLGGVRRQMLELIPELHWVAELAEGQQAQPAMLFPRIKAAATARASR